jgi:hypothetical protein
MAKETWIPVYTGMTEERCLPMVRHNKIPLNPPLKKGEIMVLFFGGGSSEWESR